MDVQCSYNPPTMVRLNSAPVTDNHAFSKAIASDGARRHKGDACFRSPHRKQPLAWLASGTPAQQSEILNLKLEI